MRAKSGEAPWPGGHLWVGRTRKIAKEESDMKKLYLSDTNKKIGGVCGGMGEYFDIDPTLMRVIFILVTLLSFGLGIIGYILIWMIIPRKPKNLQSE